MRFLRVLSCVKISIRFCNNSKSEHATMKCLNVAEKNDAAKNIAALLSRGNSTRREGYSPYNKIYEFETTLFGQQTRMVMTSVSGHLFNYEFVTSFRGWQSCHPVALFDAPIIKSCPENYLNIKRTLEREIRASQMLVIWTDCDREGENIGYEVIQVCTAIKPNLRVYRAKFSEITAASVFRALNNLAQPNKNVSDAVDVRQELDLRTGAAFTRLQTLRLQKVFPQKLADKLISYGSCQFPTLGFVVERYQAIEDFIGEKFWKIKMNHKLKDLTVDFNWQRDRLFDKAACEGILDVCKEAPIAMVECVESKPKNKWRPLPLDTVELEKIVSRKLRINAKDTMKIAEKLYTQGFISYPRTETNMFPKELNLTPLVTQQCADNRWGAFAQQVLNEGSPNPREGSKSDQAHPPIHPTKYTNNLTGNEQRIYEYVVRHFLACVSKDAVGHETVVHVDIAREKFVAKGLMILERNYLDVYTYENWKAKEIHYYEEGDTFTPNQLDMAEGSTSPPKLLTEADLIALMEKHGIGTDATHAEHIETIKSREYVGLHENMYFVPGTLGMGLVEGYNTMGLEVSLAKPKLRAEFEKDLQLICDGRKNPDTVRSDQIEKYKAVFVSVTEKIVQIDQSLASRLGDQPQPLGNSDPTNRETFKPVLKCPKCGSDMIIRNRKNDQGKYLGCVAYPACNNAKWFPSSIESIDVLDRSCTICGPNVKTLRVKFKQNPFPGDPNPSTLCIGGCDTTVMEALEIRPSVVKKPNPQNSTITRPVSTQAINRPTTSAAIVLTQNTLNEWVTGASQPPGNRQTSINTSQRSTNSTATNNTSYSNQTTRIIGHSSTSTAGPRWSSQSTGTAGNSRNNQSQQNNNRASQSGDASTITRTNQWMSRSFLNANARSNYSVNNGSTLNLLPGPSQNNRTANNDNRFGNFNHSRWGGNSSGGGDADEEGDREIVCNCNVPAIELTVRKEGPNTGRKFYKCQNNICNFFSWASGSDNNANAGNTSTARVPSGHLKCDCDLPAVQKTVQKQGPNTGRQFYCCPKPMGEGCRFFKWADEVDGNNHNDDDNDDDDPGGWGGGGNASRGNNTWSGGNRRRSNRSSFPKRKGKAKKGSQPYKSQGRAKRKCGLCGGEGHIRSKCPNS